jgi:cysteinyl-tRNA synthetase
MPTGRPLALYNSLVRRTEEFRPSADITGIFSCGPLVFVRQHLGIIRAYVCIDVLRRALHWKGINTRHITMITDMSIGRDGRPQAASPADPRAIRSSETYTRLFLDDLGATNILRADVYPRVSEHITDMIVFAEMLERRGYAYPTRDGLCFDTSKVGDYGALARMNVAAQQAGSDADVHADRRSTSDFALWRLVSADDGLSGWDSPWGYGVPGAHLPCSAVATKLLGSHFDLHTGGKHHRQLHHVNEIAQSEAYLGDGRPWVRYWIHHDNLALGTRPMAREKAPDLTDIAGQGIHPMAFRFFVLNSYYRKMQTYNQEAIQTAQNTLRRLVVRTECLGQVPTISTYAEAAAQISTATACGLLDRLDAAICDDLHMPRAVAVLYEILRNRDLPIRERRVLVASSDAVMGLNFASLHAEDLRQPGLPTDGRRGRPVT